VTNGTAGLLRATVTAGAGSLTRIDFGAGRGLTNASISVDGGPADQRAAFRYTPTSGATQVTFTARPIATGQPLMATLVAVDGCGDWPTFVAAGPRGL
jgi:hypothetical protein